MAVKYKLYTAEENGNTLKEYFTKKELLQYKITKDEEITLFECAERMVGKFNRTVKEGERKRYAYKLEKVTINVLGSEVYYGLNVSNEMTKPEFN